jgi:hypothetical protein
MIAAAGAADRFLRPELAIRAQPRSLDKRERRIKKLASKPKRGKSVARGNCCRWQRPSPLTVKRNYRFLQQSGRSDSPALSPPTCPRLPSPRERKLSACDSVAASVPLFLPPSGSRRAITVNPKATGVEFRAESQAPTGESSAFCYRSCRQRHSRCRLLQQSRVFGLARPPLHKVRCTDLPWRFHKMPMGQDCNALNHMAIRPITTCTRSAARNPSAT